jgi:hypothetical protein
MYTYIHIHTHTQARMWDVLAGRILPASEIIIDKHSSLTELHSKTATVFASFLNHVDKTRQETTILAKNDGNKDHGDSENTGGNVGCPNGESDRTNGDLDRANGDSGSASLDSHRANDNWSPFGTDLGVTNGDSGRSSLDSHRANDDLGPTSGDLDRASGGLGNGGLGCASDDLGIAKASAFGPPLDVASVER